MRKAMGARGIDLSGAGDSEICDGVLYQLFPNTFVFKNPAGKLSYRFRPVRGSPEKCVFELINLQPLPPGAAMPKDTPLKMLKKSERFEDFSAVLGVLGYLIDEDVLNCSKVQRGLHNLDFINLARTQEANIAHFQRQIDEMLDEPV
jgi:hypothetical protein